MESQKSLVNIEPAGGVAEGAGARGDWAMDPAWSDGVVDSRACVLSVEQHPEVCVDCVPFSVDHGVGAGAYCCSEIALVGGKCGCAYRC